MSEGEIKKFSQQVIIDAYGNGGFRFADMSHVGSLLCLPSGIQAWGVKGAEEITLETLKPILDLANEIDVLMIGLGEDIAFFDAKTRAVFKQNSIIIEAVSTGAAISTYNILLAEKRAVAAALVAVERKK